MMACAGLALCSNLVRQHDALSMVLEVGILVFGALTARLTWKRTS
jgi:hypothetical protein